MITETQGNPKPNVHLGRNTQRIREIIGMKQETLADLSGMSQQNISKLERSEFIADETLEKLAKGLGVNTDIIKNFNEEKAIYNIQSNITISDSASNSNYNYQPTYYPIEKVTELFDKLLQSEKEKVDLLTKANQALHDLIKEVNELKKGKQ